MHRKRYLSLLFEGLERRAFKYFLVTVALGTSLALGCGARRALREWPVLT
jgi:hypothetical protein